MRRALFFLLLASPLTAAAQIPASLGYQGRVLRSDGTPESGVVTLGFSLYAAEVGGAELWSEDQSLALADGYYATFLGDAKALPAGLFDGTARYLEVKLAGAVLSPRQKLAAVPYALTALGVRGGTVEAASLTVAGKEVVDSSGAVSFERMRGCNGAGEILVWSGSGWACSPQLAKVSAAAPLTGEGTPSSPLTLAAASASAPGYLSPADFAAFQSKLAAVSASAPLAGSGTAASPLSLAQASASAPGYLAPADFAAFQAKLAQVAVAAPLTGDGTAASPVTMGPASGSAAGYLSAADWARFDGKVGSVAAGEGIAVSGSGTPTVAVKFGTAAGTVAAGDHAHFAEIYKRGASELGATGAVLTNLTPVTGGLALASATNDLEVASGQTHTVTGPASYRNITVRNGGILTVAAWDGSAGGKIELRATGAVTIEQGGLVNVKGKGYRGGVSSTSRYQHGQAGESYPGVGARAACTANGGGGGGGQTDTGNYGQAGAGGGYGTAGGTGLRYGGQPGCDAVGGATYGDEEINTLHLGSGGGSGGTDGDKSGRGGDGGRGGGAFSIEAQSIVVAGTIDARGDNGTDAYVESDNGGGGGGSGGSVRLFANSIEVRSTGVIDARGGAGGKPLNANYGGAGGDGRILLKGTSVTVAGALNGAAKKTSSGVAGPSFFGAGTYVSPAVSLPSGARLVQVDAFAERGPETFLALEACVADTEAATSQDSCWAPVAPSGAVDVATRPWVRVRVSVVDRSQRFKLVGVRLVAAR